MLVPSSICRIKKTKFIDIIYYLKKGYKVGTLQTFKFSKSQTEHKKVEIKYCYSQGIDVHVLLINKGKEYQNLLQEN